MQILYTTYTYSEVLNNQAGRLCSAFFLSEYSFIRDFRVEHIRECVSMVAAGTRTHISLGYHLLHRQILRLLLKPADFKTQSSLL